MKVVRTIFDGQVFILLKSLQFLSVKYTLIWISQVDKEFLYLTPAGTAETWQGPPLTNPALVTIHHSMHEIAVRETRTGRWYFEFYTYNL